MTHAKKQKEGAGPLIDPSILTSNGMRPLPTLGAWTVDLNNQEFRRGPIIAPLR
jgi:hypothetical protein